MLLSSNEEARLAAIERLQQSEQADNLALNSLVRQAATLSNAPAALFTAVGRDSVWIKASYGFPPDGSLPRECTPCSRVVETQRFLTGSFKWEFTPLRFYAGMPVFVGNACVGSLCVLDFGEREFTARDRNALAAIASAIGGILEESARRDCAPDRDLVETGLEFTDNAWMLFALRPSETLPRIEYVNARAREFTGFSLEELTTDPEAFYNTAGMADAVLLAIERAKSGDPTPAHVEIQSPSGMLWLEGSARRLSDGPGGTLRFMTIARDITAQKNAEASRDLLAEAIRQAPDAVFIVRMNGDDLRPDIIFANDAFLKLTRYDLATGYPKILGPQSDLASIREAIRAIREGRAAEGETLLYRRDGSTFRASYRGHAIDAPTRHAAIIIKDVTQERLKEQQLTMLSAAIQEAEDFVGVVDDTPVSEGGPLIVYVNPAVERATGFSVGELIGKPYNYLHSPNNPAKLRDSVAAQVDAAAPAFRELLMRRKDGTDFWIEMVGRTFTDPASNRNFRISVGRDITLRRRAFNQTALLLEASDQSSDAIVLYEPSASGDLIATYENAISEHSNQKRLLALWKSHSEAAQRIRATLERGGEVREVFAENDESGSPILVQFSARSVRNEARLEAIVSIERVIAKGNADVEQTGQSLLLRVAATLPALTRARTTDERRAILSAILLDSFGAELHSSSAELNDDAVHVASGRRGATFRLGNATYAARWARDLDGIALTALRLCIEATIDEERKAAAPQG